MASSARGLRIPDGTSRAHAAIAYVGAEEATLIREAQRGRYDAFLTLAERYDSRITALALTITGTEHGAGELAHRTFVAAYRTIWKFDFERTFFVWLHALFAELCMEHLRASKRKSEGRVVHPELPQERVAVALTVLTPEERVVFELKDRGGIGLGTVADIMGIDRDSATNTFIRASQKLLRALK